MRSKSSISIVVFGLLTSASCHGVEPPYIVKSHQARGKVVLPADATPSERFASIELVNALEQMTGVKLSVISEGREPPNNANLIYIGRTRASKKYVSEKAFEALHDDGYRVFTKAGSGFFIGGRKRGSIYAVYEYLESLGVRWYSPDYTVIPPKADIPFPSKDSIYVPKLWYRDQWWNNAPTHEWLVRMRVNGSNGQDHVLPEAMGGSVTSKYTVHSYGTLVPAGEHFAKHPEWFAIKQDGKRGADEYCLTNPELRDFVTQKVLADLRACSGEVENFWVSQNDGGLNGCYCPRCTEERVRHGGKERWSANTVSFGSEIAQRVQKEFPRVHIKMLAYSYTVAAPDGMKAPDNLVVEICGNFGVWDDAQAKLVRSWSKVASNISVYTYGGSNYGYWWPFPNAMEVGMQCPLALKSGVKAFFVQGTALGYGSGLVDLKAYLSARMAWDPSRNVTKEIRDFCNGFYGPGGKYVVEYLDWFWNDIHKRNVQLLGGWGDAERWRQWVTKDAMVRSDGLFQKALHTCRNQPVYLKHLRRAYLEVLWGRVMIDLKPGSDIRDKEFAFALGADETLVRDRAKLFGEIMREADYNMASECDPFDASKYPH